MTALGAGICVGLCVGADAGTVADIAVGILLGVWGLEVRRRFDDLLHDVEEVVAGAVDHSVEGHPHTFRRVEVRGDVAVVVINRKRSSHQGRRSRVERIHRDADLEPSELNPRADLLVSARSHGVNHHFTSK